MCNEEKICSLIHYHKIELIMMMIEMLPDLKSCQIRWSQRKHDLNIQPIRVQRSWVISNNIKKRVNLFIWCQNWNWLNCNFRLMSIIVISIWWEYNNDKAKWIVYFWGHKRPDFFKDRFFFRSNEFTFRLSINGILNIIFLTFFFTL